jgi:ParB family chromosome partitioning protein
MTQKTGLGRGLDALILGSERPTSGSVMELPVDKILPNPHQPRSRMDPGEIDELAASIREHGVIQPLIVTEGDQPGGYTLIAGERRLLAARQAGLAAVPVIIREASDQQRLELALIENLQRTDLGPLEAAEAFRQLAEDFNLSHEEIAVRVCKSRTAVTNTLRLLKLPPSVQDALADGQISEGHARALLALPTPQSQSAVLGSITSRDLNVRQTEALVRKLTAGEPSHKETAPRAPEIVALEDRLRASLGTKVTLNQRRKGGTVVIHYYSDEELTAIIDRIVGEL